jgi:hypothetical protein
MICLLMRASVDSVCLAKVNGARLRGVCGDLSGLLEATGDHRNHEKLIKLAHVAPVPLSLLPLKR